MTTRIVELRKGILKKNDELAALLRQRYAEAGLLVLNLVSSPGTGKTAFLERTLRDLRQRGARVAALVGDLETDNDARRLAASGAPVRQINTHGICHLDAEMIAKHLEGLELAEFEMLFIENVGNLVCPSSYDLGEKTRVALLSVTEGEDKPLKYPTLFNSADVAVITKMDLAEACGFDRATALRNINEIRPGIKVFETSARTGAGMDEWLEFLLRECGLPVGGAVVAAQEPASVAEWTPVSQPRPPAAIVAPLLPAQWGVLHPVAELLEPPAPFGSRVPGVSPAPAKMVAPNWFPTTREAKEFLIALIVAEAVRAGRPLLDVERKILFDTSEGWMPDDMDGVREIFQRYHDQDEYEVRLLGLIRAAKLRLRANPAEFERWRAAVGDLRGGRDYLASLIAAAEGRKPGWASRVGFWVALAVVVGILAVAVVWFRR